MAKRIVVTAAWILIFIGMAAPTPAAEEKPAGKDLKILVVGNSFSRNATKFLGEIVGSAEGCRLLMAHASIGGCSLEKHCSLAMRHESDPADPEGMPYTLKDKPAGLKEMLLSEKWDYVTLQQFSKLSMKPNSYQPYAKRLCEYIHKYAPQAEIVFHQTWAYRSDDTETYVDGYTPEKMHQEVAAAYHAVAKELGVKRIIPTGEAFHIVSESPEWRFLPDAGFDYKNPVYPKRPKEIHSLHAGYSWKGADGKRTLALDTHHANAAGEFLGGCVWFEFFFGEDVRRLRFKPRDMSEADAAFLRQAAHKAAAGAPAATANPVETTK